MIVKCECPLCHGEFPAVVWIECFENQIFDTEAAAKQYLIDHIAVKTILQNNHEI